MLLKQGQVRWAEGFFVKTWCAVHGQCRIVIWASEKLSRCTITGQIIISSRGLWLIKHGLFNSKPLVQIRFWLTCWSSDKPMWSTEAVLMQQCETTNTTTAVPLTSAPRSAITNPHIKYKQYELTCFYRLHYTTTFTFSIIYRCCDVVFDVSSHLKPCAIKMWSPRKQSSLYSTACSFV